MTPLFVTSTNRSPRAVTSVFAIRTLGSIPASYVAGRLVRDRARQLAGDDVQRVGGLALGQALVAGVVGGA